MIIAFLVGFLLASFVGGLTVFRLSKELQHVQEDYELLAEESNVLFGSFHKLVSDIGAGADKKAIYSRILRTLTLSCDASSACFYEKNADDKLFVAACEGVFPPQKEVNPLLIDANASRAELISTLLKGEELEFGEGIIGTAAAEKSPIFIKNASASARVVNHKDSLMKVTSLIAVPIYFRDEFYGVLALANPINGGMFNDADYSVVRSIADQTALLLYSVNTISLLVEKSKIDFDLSLASSVQSYILPQKLSNVGGYEFASRYIPQQKVGGDFYDTFRLNDDKIGVVIGDVSGKGISAALIMAICQTMLRYIAREFNSPSQVLKELNLKMFNAMRKDMFITVIYAIIDTKNGKITLARAGHEKPILCSKKNGTIFPKSKGAAIGMIAPKLFDLTISDIEIDFEVDDYFVLYTDGVTESVNPQGEEFTTDRLKRIIEENQNLSAEDLNEKITQNVREFSNGANRTDDYTLVTVRRNN